MKVNLENNRNCPTSLYGVSKIAGEEIGHFFSTREQAFEFIALRIGWVVYDSPFAHKNTPLNDYLESMYLSKNDCIGYFLAAAETTNINNENPFYVGYAISNNKTALYDIKNTCETLAFAPTTE